jgi:hypothetical protein
MKEATCLHFEDILESGEELKILSIMERGRMLGPYLRKRLKSEHAPIAWPLKKKLRHMTRG